MPCPNFQRAWDRFAQTAYLLPDRKARAQLAEQIAALSSITARRGLDKETCDRQFTEIFATFDLARSQIILAGSVPLADLTSRSLAPALNWLSRDRERQLIFLESDLVSLARILHSPRCCEFLQKSQVWLHYCASPHREFALQLLASDVAFESFEFRPWSSRPFWAGFCGELTARAGQIRGICDELLQAPDTANFSLQNAVAQASDVDIAHLKGALRGMPALLCGAGPSLESQLSLVAKSLDRALVIGCGSAALALQRAEIAPHAVASICPLRASFERWHRLDLFSAPGLTCLRAFPGVAELMFGPRIHLTGLSAAPCTRWVEAALGFEPSHLDYGNSVLTAVLRACLQMGCDPIYLVGVDLCYSSSGDKYATGVEALKAPQQSAPGVFGLTRAKCSSGELVATNLPWLTEVRNLSQLANEYPKARIFTTSSRALPADGIAPASLADWLKTRPQQRDVVGQLWRCLAGKAQERPLNRARFDPLRTSLIRCLDLFRQRQSLLPLEVARGGRLTSEQLHTYLESLELSRGRELAFDVLLKPLQGALEHFFHRRLQHLKKGGGGPIADSWRGVCLLEMASQKLTIYQQRGERLLRALDRICQCDRPQPMG